MGYKDQPLPVWVLRIAAAAKFSALLLYTIKTFYIPTMMFPTRLTIPPPTPPPATTATSPTTPQSILQISPTFGVSFILKDSIPSLNFLNDLVRSLVIFSRKDRQLVTLIQPLLTGDILF